MSSKVTGPRRWEGANPSAAAARPLPSTILNRRALLTLAAAAVAGGAAGCAPGRAQPATAPPATTAANPALGPWRPGFHYTTPENQINDPNGLFWLDGTYHLCHQYNVAGEVHWGHATSSDLLHWTRQQPALDPDEIGQIWSGSAVVDRADTSGLRQGSTPPVVAFFTYSERGSGAQSQGRAYSTDGGLSWTKDPENPILPNNGRRDFRDPKVLWHAPTRRWVMVVTVGEQLDFFASTDLRGWDQVGSFGVGHGAHGGAWECPDLFELPIEGTAETRWVLSVSVIDGAPGGGSGMQYFIGSFDGATFHNEHNGSLVLWQNFGPDFYAGVTWGDDPSPDGRRLMIAWTDNWRYREVVPSQPFNGQLSTICDLSLVSTGDGIRLRHQPMEEYARLRRAASRLEQVTVTGSHPVDDARGDSLDIGLDLEVDAGTDAGVEVLAGPVNRVRVGYDGARRTVYLDRSRAGVIPQRDGQSLGPEWATRYDASVPTDPDGRLRLRVLVDRSSVDVYTADGLMHLSALVLPEPTDTQVRLFAATTTMFRSVETSQMTSTW